MEVFGSSSVNAATWESNESDDDPGSCLSGGQSTAVWMPMPGYALI
jgi:hypothetical protein